MPSGSRAKTDERQMLRVRSTLPNELNAACAERDRLEAERDMWHGIADERAAEIVRLLGVIVEQRKQNEREKKG